MIEGNALDANIVFKSNWELNDKMCYGFCCRDCKQLVCELKSKEKVEIDNALKTIKEHTSKPYCILQDENIVFT
jgi:hypothetical protein